MIPKTELIYSYPYNALFNKEFNHIKLEELKIKFSKFEDLYNKYIKKILIFIEKFNEPWRKKYIPIYLTEKTKPISSPLTLRYEENEKYILVVLIHELIHNNISKKFIDRNALHTHISNITKRVCSELDLDLSKEVKELENRIFN
ncbi:MAG: hypothetical protein QW117_03250 [Candidatus Pacearchaeota archaeon]